MHIIGELTFLPEATPTNQTPPLPIPWYVRGPLGMLTNTHVFVAIIRPDREDDSEDHDKVGEMIVSVINPTHDVIRIQCKKKDEPGVLTRVFSTLQKLPGRHIVKSV